MIANALTYCVITQIIECGLIVVCYCLIILTFAYFLICGIPSGILPLRYFSPSKTYLATRYIHLLGYLWSRLFNSMFSQITKFPDVLWDIASAEYGA